MPAQSIDMVVCSLNNIHWEIRFSYLHIVFSVLYFLPFTAFFYPRNLFLRIPLTIESYEIFRVDHGFAQTATVIQIHGMVFLIMQHFLVGNILNRICLHCEPMRFRFWGRIGIPKHIPCYFKSEFIILFQFPFQTARV